MKIAFLGDIALIGKYDLTKNPEAKDKLKCLSEELEQYDYVVGNLESPLTNKDKTLVCKSMHLKSDMINVELLKYLNIDAVSLANNHTYDYGKKGIEETIKTLDDNKIEWFGVNSKTLIKEIDGEKISFSGFCCFSTNGTNYKTKNKTKGVNLLNYENVINQLETDKENNAFSILSFHWGDEHTNYPKYEHVRLAKKIAKKNDVLIVGHHPHIIQGVQKINNSVIAYSLGNFLFDDCVSINGNFKLIQNTNNKKTFIFEVEIQNGTISENKFRGVRDEEEFVFFNIENEINEISKPLYLIKDYYIYEDIRIKQIRKERQKKFGKRNIKWLRSRLNYYSIGAYLSAKILNRKYLKEKKKFLSE